MSCASSLGVITCTGSYLYRWTPGFDPTLDALHDLDQEHSGGHDGEHANEHLVGLEARAGLADHRANSCCRSVDFADHHADHAAADSEPEPRQQKGDRARQDDGPEQPNVAGAEAC